MLKRVLVTAGGTGGHIYPAVALLEEFQRRGYEILYIGNKNSPEEKIALQRGLPFAAINVQRLYRSLTLKHIRFPFKLLQSLLLTFGIIRRFRPDVCIGCGGFVSYPATFIAALMRIPLYLQEQNSFPGITTRLASRHARRIFIGYQIAANHLPINRCFYSGNPLLDSYSEIVKNRTLSSSVTLLILGGSQGASFLNRSVLKLIPELLKRNVKLIWQTGERELNSITKTVQDNYPDAAIELYAYHNDMPALYRRADIALCRAGALTLAELESFRIPCLIVPLPKSAGNHQYLNAKHQQDDYRGIMIRQKDFSESEFLEGLNHLIRDYREIQSNLSSSKHSGATKTIVDNIVYDFEDMR